MTHPHHIPWRLIWQVLLLTALILLMARPAHAIDSGHLKDIKDADAANLFDAFIAPAYYLVDDEGAAAVTGFDRPLPTFIKPVRFAVVLYLDVESARREAKEKSQREGRKYSPRATTLARAFKNLYQHKDDKASEDYQQPDFLIFDNPTMREVRVEYLVDDTTKKPYVAQVDRARYIPAFFSRTEAIAYQKSLHKQTGRSYTRVGQGVEGFMKFMAGYAASATQVRVFGYQSSTLIANYEKAIHEQMAAKEKAADRQSARVIRRGDASISDRITTGKDRQAD